MTDERFHFGLGPIERIGRVTVVWPKGEPSVLADAASGRVMRVRR